MSSMYCIGSLLSEGRFREYDERDRRESTASGPTPRGRSGRGEHPAQEAEGARLVERLVEVAALRALDAGRAAALARTALQQLRRVRGPALEDLEAALGDPDAARVAVVD